MSTFSSSLRYLGHEDVNVGQKWLVALEDEDALWNSAGLYRPLELGRDCSPADEGTDKFSGQYIHGQANKGESHRLRSWRCHPPSPV